MKKLETFFEAKEKEEIIQDPYVHDIIERKMGLPLKRPLILQNRIISIEGVEKPRDYFEAILRLEEAGILPLECAQHPPYCRFPDVDRDAADGVLANFLSIFDHFSHRIFP